MINNMNNMDPISDVSKVANRKKMGDDVEKLREKVSRETSKIIKLRVAQDTAYWDLKEKLQAVEANHERLQANMVDVQMQHEAISASYEAELRRRPETLNKLAASRAIADTLEENAARLRESLRRQAADCVALQNAYGGAAQRAVLAVAGAQGAVRAQRASFEGAIERERVTAERAAAAAASYCQQAECARRDAASATHEIKLLRESLHAAKSDLDRTTARCAILVEEVEHLKSREHNAARVLIEAETERQRLTAEIQSTRDQLERDDVELERVRGEVARLQADLRAESARLQADLEGERSARACAVAELERERSARACAVAELKGERSAHACTVAELEGERSARACAVAELERERSACASAVAELEGERSARSSAVAELEGERSARASAVAELERERSARASAVAELEGERSARASAVAELEGERSARASALAELERERSARACAVAELEAERSALARAITELERERSGRRGAQAEWRAERETLVTEVNAARAALARLEQEAGGERARLEKARVAAEEHAARLLAQLEEERARGRDAAAALDARADTISDLMRNVTREVEKCARAEDTIKAHEATLRKKEADLVDRMNIINELRAEKERLQEKMNAMQGTIDNIQMELARDVQTTNTRAAPGAAAVRELPERDRAGTDTMDFSFLMSESSGDSLSLDVGEVNRKVRDRRERAQQVRAAHRSVAANISAGTNRSGVANRTNTVNSSGATNSSSAINRSSGVNSSGTTNRYFFKTKRLDAKRK